MEFETVAALLQGVPHMEPERGRELYDFVRRTRPASVLELGFAHGVSTCYIAAALTANGHGVVTTLDLEVARERDPDLDTLLDRTGLRPRVRAVHAERSYTWELMLLIDATDPGRRPCFDFAFVDGAHSWDTDGFAFFLIDKLLKAGGWILFDDLDWSYASSPSLRHSDTVLRMPAAECEMRQVGKVFELLVREHPSYGDFRVDGAWGWARKRRDGAPQAPYARPTSPS